MTRAKYRERGRLGRALLAADQAKVRTVRQVIDVQPLTRQQTDDILRHHCKELAPEQTRDIIDLFHQHISQDLATEMQPTASELHTELTECIDAVLLYYGPADFHHYMMLSWQGRNQPRKYAEAHVTHVLRWVSCP